MQPTHLVMMEAYTPGEDSHGAPTDSWQPPAPVHVYGWSPAEDAQPIEGNRRPVQDELDLYAPASLGGPLARWAIDGATYEQQGHANSYNTGPWGARFGYVIKLRRLEG